MSCASNRAPGGGPIPFYFGPPGRALFGWYAGGAAPERPCGVVLCNPIGDDAIRAHRVLRYLAERLSGAGFATLRFDFHGTGDSSGDEREPCRARTWISDIHLAVDALRARSGAPEVAVVGLRCGGTLATIAAAELGGVDSLVLWGPHPSGRAFVSESTRTHRMHRMLEPQSFAGGPQARPDGEEALGFLLTHETIEGLSEVELRALVTRPARRALIVSDGGAPGAGEIVEHLRSLGATAEVRALPGCQQFLMEPPHRSRLPEDAIEVTVEYLSRAHPNVDAPLAARAAASDTGASPSGEEPIVFGHSHRLFGILHHARGPRDAPSIVLVNAGTVHRIGPHRFYVPLARRLAELGFPVLRLDLSGIGDSSAGERATVNVTYPRDGLRDVAEAMDLLAERTGARRFILTGLCSGGDIAFQMGSRDPRVAGAVMMNPRTFCVNDLEKVEGRDASTRTTAAKLLESLRLRAPADVARVPASLRRMAQRGVSALLVVTAHDPGVEYVDARCGAEMRALLGVPGFRRVDVEGTDHNFTSLWSQSHVSDLVTGHLTRRFLE